MDDNYEKIRLKIEKRYKQRGELVIHTIAFILTNIMLWLFWMFTGGDYFPWPMFVTFGWGIGWISHIIEYYNKYGAGADRREDAIQREVERELARRGIYEKPKNENRLEISEDGEIEIIEDEASNQYRRN